MTRMYGGYTPKATDLSDDNLLCHENSKNIGQESHFYCLDIVYLSEAKHC